MSSPLISCINLSRLLPISKLEQNINAISSLVYQDDETLDNFLQKVDQPLIVQNERGGFICCEYNRDGNSYRIPGTSEFVPPVTDGIVPSEKLLELEKALNGIFRIYTNFYYSNTATSSVYCYEIDESNPDEFVVAVLIRNKIEESSSKGTNGIWEASNLVTVSIDSTSMEVTYDLISSVNVYLNASINSGLNSKLTVGGSMTKNVRETHKYKELDIQFHTEKIGNLIENLETRIRDEIETIYFQKTTQIIGTARNNGDVQGTISNLRNIMSDV